MAHIGKYADIYEENSPLDGVEMPKGLKYSSLKFGFIRIPYYCSPKAQLLIVSFVCFLCPGMFNALNGMGGGGQIDTETANAANATLYGVFAIVGFFSGTFTNKLGIKTALGLGGLGYSLYIASFLSYNFNSNRGFCIFAGAILGACAGLLWTAQGAIMMSYPKEKSKGRYISWFWIIFNTGGVLGGLVSSQNMCNINDTQHSCRSHLEQTLTARQPRASPTAHTSDSLFSPFSEPSWLSPWHPQKTSYARMAQKSSS